MRISTCADRTAKGLRRVLGSTFVVQLVRRRFEKSRCRPWQIDPLQPSNSLSNSRLRYRGLLEEPGGGLLNVRAYAVRERERERERDPEEAHHGAVVCDHA